MYDPVSNNMQTTRCAQGKEARLDSGKALTTWWRQLYGTGTYGCSCSMMSADSIRMDFNVYTLYRFRKMLQNIYICCVKKHKSIIHELTTFSDDIIRTAPAFCLNHILVQAKHTNFKCLQQRRNTSQRGSDLLKQCKIRTLQMAHDYSEDRQQQPDKTNHHDLILTKDKIWKVAETS